MIIFIYERQTENGWLAACACGDADETLVAQSWFAEDKGSSLFSEIRALLTHSGFLPRPLGMNMFTNRTVEANFFFIELKGALCPLKDLNRKWHDGRARLASKLGWVQFDLNFVKKTRKGGDVAVRERKGRGRGR